jgi:hypothetical protein
MPANLRLEPGPRSNVSRVQLHKADNVLHRLIGFGGLRRWIRRSAAASSAIRAEPLPLNPAVNFWRPAAGKLNSSGVLSDMAGLAHSP